MAYTKLPKIVTDYSLGYQSINTLSGNFTAQFSAWQAEHGTAEPQYDRDRNTIQAPPNQQIGAHSSPAIPRAMVRVMVPASTFAFPAAQSSGGPFIGQVWRYGTGLFLVEVTGLQTWWGRATPAVTSSSTQARVVARTLVPPTSGQPQGVWCVAYTNVAGTWTKTDMTFSLAIYGSI